MKRFWHLFGPRGEQGSITPVVALGLAGFVGVMALSIDVGQLSVVRNELQNVADAAALAGAKRLIQAKDPANPGVAAVYCSEAIQAAKDYVNKNYSLGSSDPLVITDGDVTIGLWDLTTKQFTRTGCTSNPAEVNALKVTVSRSGGTGGNPQVTTLFGSFLGVGTRDPQDVESTGPTKMDVAASAVALLGLAGTSSVDVPFMLPSDYASGGGVASNGWQRLLDKVAPTPAYAAFKSYKWYDKADGGTSSNPPLVTNRASWTVAKDTESAGATAYYAMQKYLQGTERFPQKQVGEKLYPATEHIYGQYIKDYFTWMKTRWTNKRNPSTLKWRVTVPVFKTTPVTAALPQNSWMKLAASLIPGVSQAHACTLIPIPVVYTQGFATIDITKVYVDSDCNQANNGTTQKNDTNSCRNTCYMEFDVPLDQNTVSTDKGSNPIPFQKDYKDMNTSANEVGVFASVPRIVK